MKDIKINKLCPNCKDVLMDYRGESWGRDNYYCGKCGFDYTDRREK